MTARCVLSKGVAPLSVVSTSVALAVGPCGDVGIGAKSGVNAAVARGAKLSSMSGSCEMDMSSIGGRMGPAGVG
ncbi:hypothetical protein EDB83DRAFT_2440943 [Lactarius deliciosus]|nr:hypothetical protein EDB83DRAFT_2440943 [Lactarius deliciosus]